MAFGSKKPEIKSKRESFADALAKYREEEATLKKSKILLDFEVIDLRAQADNYERMVAGAKQRLVDLNSQIAIAETNISDKQKQHLIWVDSVLQEEHRELRVLTESNRIASAVLESGRQDNIKYKFDLDQLKSLLEQKRIDFENDKKAFEDEKIQERLNAVEDRKRLDVLIAEHKELVRVLAEREKNSRPIPKPITIQKNRRR